jgi:hypothetical protein
MKNLAASIRDRLMNQARATGMPFAALLERFVIGRLLWRLSQSEVSDEFVLKGAQLFALWAGKPHRPTRDLDLLGKGDASPEALQALFSDLLRPAADPEDGLVWSAVTAALIREDQPYEGVRITARATLGQAVVPAQVDIGFGDAITPGPMEVQWKDLLGFPEARLLAYPPETVIAEKLEAATVLGMANSRMKDFYDLQWLCGNREFEADVLEQAIRATFGRRGTPMPETMPLPLTAGFAAESSKRTQWSAFLKKNKLEALSLDEVITQLAMFLQPVLFPTPERSRLWKPLTGWITPTP